MFIRTTLSLVNSLSVIVYLLFILNIFNVLPYLLWLILMFELIFGIAMLQKAGHYL
jgi:hypothetical protein